MKAQAVIIAFLILFLLIMIAILPLLLTISYLPSLKVQSGGSVSAIVQQKQVEIYNVLHGNPKIQLMISNGQEYLSFVYTSGNTPLNILGIYYNSSKGWAPAYPGSYVVASNTTLYLYTPPKYYGPILIITSLGNYFLLYPVSSLGFFISKPGTAYSTQLFMKFQGSASFSLPYGEPVVIVSNQSNTVYFYSSVSFGSSKIITAGTSFQSSSSVPIIANVSFTQIIFPTVSSAFKGVTWTYNNTPVIFLSGKQYQINQPTIFLQQVTIQGGATIQINAPVIFENSVIFTPTFYPTPPYYNNITINSKYPIIFGLSPPSSLTQFLIYSGVNVTINSASPIIISANQTTIGQLLLGSTTWLTINAPGIVFNGTAFPFAYSGFVAFSGSVYLTFGGNTVFNLPNNAYNQRGFIHSFPGSNVNIQVKGSLILSAYNILFEGSLQVTAKNIILYTTQAVFGGDTAITITG